MSLSSLSPTERQLWVIAAIFVVGLDTATTYIAVESGLGVEANPLLAGLTGEGRWLELAALKAVVLGGVFAVWTRADLGPFFRRAVPVFAAGAGVLVTLSNGAMVTLGAVL